MASTNCSLQLFVPITRARFVFLRSLSTVLWKTAGYRKPYNELGPIMFLPLFFKILPSVWSPIWWSVWKLIVHFSSDCMCLFWCCNYDINKRKRFPPWTRTTPLWRPPVWCARPASVCPSPRSASHPPPSWSNLPHPPPPLRERERESWWEDLLTLHGQQG